MMRICLAIVAACALSACIGFSEEGFVSVFNGRDFSGWEGSWMNGYYRVAADGSLECVGGKGWGRKTIRNIWTTREYSNFVFRCEYKVTPRTNNGIGIRRPGGHITLCWHNDTMWFRNLEIKELK